MSCDVPLITNKIGQHCKTPEVSLARLIREERTLHLQPLFRLSHNASL